MSTARDFITMAMKEAGILGIGQTLLEEDINDGLILLNRMLAQWQKKRWLVPSLYEISGLGNNQKSNTIGPGQYYNAARPDKIQSAYFNQLNGGGTSNEVSFPLIPVWSYEDYSLITLKNLNSWPQYYFYDGAFPYGNIYIWPIPSENYSIHLIMKGPIGFTIELEAIEILSNSTQFVDGVYYNVPLLNFTGIGSGATADVEIVTNLVASITIRDKGNGYRIGDLLKLDMAGVEYGDGFTMSVIQVTGTLDAEFNMPPEYEEAIHYNLCLRLRSMYQYPADIIQTRLARAALNTLRVANSQIPTLGMPSALRFRRNGNPYIFNIDAR